MNPCYKRFGLNAIPFSQRTFTLDGERCDIEDFISSNSKDFKDAKILREDIAELQVDVLIIIEGHNKQVYQVYRMT